MLTHTTTREQLTIYSEHMQKIHFHVDEIVILMQKVYKELGVELEDHQVDSAEHGFDFVICQYIKHDLMNHLN